MGKTKSKVDEEPAARREEQGPPVKKKIKKAEHKQAEPKRVDETGAIQRTCCGRDQPQGHHKGTASHAPAV